MEEALGLGIQEQRSLLSPRCRRNSLKPKRDQDVEEEGSTQGVRTSQASILERRAVRDRHDDIREDEMAKAHQVGRILKGGHPCEG